MGYLLIEQKKKQVHLKSWRLSPKASSVFTLGQSRKADLRAIDTAIRGIHGVFEYRTDSWWYINLDPDTSSLAKDFVQSEVCLNGPIEFNFNETQICITPVPDKAELFKNIPNAAEKTGQMHQLIVVKKDGHVLKSHVLKQNESLKINYDKDLKLISPNSSEGWQPVQMGDVEVKSTQIYLHDQKDLEKAQHKLDSETKKPLIAVLTISFLLALVIGFAPKTKIEVDIFETPRVVSTNIREASRELKKRQQEKSTAKSSRAAKNADYPKNAPKAAAVISSIRKTGLSRLISKVSAQAARSKNIVITQGAAAGSKATGRALASVGSMKSVDKANWNGQVGGTKGVSTVGKGGGLDGHLGMGTMATNGVGTGGVGLIEDESEITGGLDREVIAQYIRSQLGQILYCYERQLSARPDLFGKVAVNFIIGSTGSVETQKIGDSSLKDSKVEGCILQRVAKWQFPKPQGGMKVVVTYPFLFKSTN